MPAVIIAVVILAIVIYTVCQCACIVPQKQAYLIERLGKYHETLSAGFHILLPFIDRIAYRRDLKEVTIDVPPQQCVTKDNIIVDVDGILYLQIMDPVKASYGIQDYMFACSQLAQTTLRSEIGKLELDRTFEERVTINAAICSEVDKASDPWGVKVTRYEIKTIKPPMSVLDAMEKQMRAEREKRALIAESEGERQSRINKAEGVKQEAIELSEGERQRRINEAMGHAQEIQMVAQATADGIRALADAIAASPFGKDAVNLKLAEQYIVEFGKLAKENNTMIIPADLANLASIVKAVGTVIEKKP